MSVFRVGDRVRISPQSGYYRNQPHRPSVDTGNDRDAVGVVTDTSGYFSIIVRWAELNYGNVYEVSDLMHETAPTQATRKFVCMLFRPNGYNAVTVQVQDERYTENMIIDKVRHEFTGLSSGATAVLLDLGEATNCVEQLFRGIECVQQSAFDVQIRRGT